MRIIFFATLCCLFFGRLAFAEGYLCIQDQVVGFVYNGKQKTWQQAQFKPEKYLIKRYSDSWKVGSDKTKWPHWYVTHFGANDWPWVMCLDDFAENGNLVCDRTLASGFMAFGFDANDTVIHFNRNTLRFLESYNNGYYAQGMTRPSTDGEIKERKAALQRMDAKERKSLDESAPGWREMAEEGKKLAKEIEKSSPSIAIGTCSEI